MSRGEGRGRGREFRFEGYDLSPRVVNVYPASLPTEEEFVVVSGHNLSKTTSLSVYNNQTTHDITFDLVDDTLQFPPPSLDDGIYNVAVSDGTHISVLPESVLFGPSPVAVTRIHPPRGSEHVQVVVTGQRMDLVTGAGLAQEGWLDSFVPVTHISPTEVEFRIPHTVDTDDLSILTLNTRYGAVHVPDAFEYNEPVFEIEPTWASRYDNYPVVVTGPPIFDLAEYGVIRTAARVDVPLLDFEVISISDIYFKVPSNIPPVVQLFSSSELVEILIFDSDNTVLANIPFVLSEEGPVCVPTSYSPAISFYGEVPDYSYAGSDQTSQVVSRYTYNADHIVSVAIDDMPVVDFETENNILSFTLPQKLVEEDTLLPLIVGVDIGGYQRFDNFVVYYDNSPRLFSVQPFSVGIEGNETVVIQGVQLSDITSVLFDGQPASSVIVISDNEISCVPPPYTGPLNSSYNGPDYALVSISVVTGDGTFESDMLFQYVDKSKIDSITPAYALVGSGPTEVTLHGSKFKPTDVIYVDLAIVDMTFVSDTEIKITIPDADSAYVSTIVSTRGGEITFLHSSGPPVIDKVWSPLGPPAGYWTSINGHGLTGITSVTIDAGTAVEFYNYTDTAFSVSLPAHALTATSSVSLTVTTPAGTYTLQNAVGFQNGIPYVGSVNPTDIPIDSGVIEVTLLGTDLTGVNGATLLGENLADGTFFDVPDTALVVVSDSEAKISFDTTGLPYGFLSFYLTRGTVSSYSSVGDANRASIRADYDEPEVQPQIAGTASFEVPSLEPGPESRTAPSPQVRTVPEAVSAPNRYIVVFKDDVSFEEVHFVAQHMPEGSVDIEYTEALKGFSFTSTPEVAEALARDPRVKYVTEDSVVSLGAVQDIPSQPWGLDRIDQKVLPLNKKYVYTNTADNVHVYIIDTGVRFGHEEFEGRAVPGLDIAAGADSTGDCNGHGTHVAGVVGGKTYGVAKSVTIHAVRVLNCTGQGLASQVIAGVDWVTSNAIKPAVVNMSVVSAGSTALDTAVKKSVSKGITYVVSAGNNGANASSYSPARLPEVITVGAVGGTSGFSDVKPSFSNYGTAVDIFAPGVNILSAYGTSNSRIATMDGTSMAAPHVAGVAAMYLSLHPEASPAEVKAAIIKAASTGLVGYPGAGSANRLLSSQVNVLTPTRLVFSALSRSGSTRVEGILQKAENCSPTEGCPPLVGAGVSVYFKAVGATVFEHKGDTMTDPNGIFVDDYPEAPGTWRVAYSGTGLYSAAFSEKVV